VTDSAAAQSEQDETLLADCIDAIGASVFPQRFCAFCAALAGADTAYLTAFFDSAGPVEIHSSHTDPDRLAALGTYLDVAFVLDPFYKLFQEKRGNQVAGLSDIAPDDFRRSEYYRTFFKAMNLADECGVMLHLADDAALFLSLGVQGRGHLNEERLTAMLPVLDALARRHWTVLTPERFHGTGRLAAHLERAFEEFGSSVLSPRESQIVRMVLRGHSSKAIANALDNSPETIKVHRKRIYAKLGIASQGELLSTFLTALTHMPATGKGDPLAYLTGTNPNG